jgi:iron complex outermembrane receptor protein
MKNSIALIVLCFLCAVSFKSFSQTHQITGRITGTGGEFLIGAVAELRNAKDSSLAKVSVADVTGVYHLENPKAGSYFIKTSFLGYDAWFSELFNYDGASTKTISEIKMKATAVQLKSAEISAFLPLVEVKADKTVFNVESSINSTGSTAFELLQKAPGVVVDNNDNVSLKGRGGVMVQIDGRPTRMTETELADYLKSIQSTDVESIELISNPSSKYDAEGTAGIINIKLKRNKNYGTNGSLTAGYAIGKYSKYNTAITLNTRTPKLNIFTNYSNNWGDRQNEFYLYREQNPYTFTQSSISKRSGLSHNYKAGLDYTINKKNNIGLMVTGNYSDTKSVQTNRNEIRDFSTQAVDSILKSDQSSKNLNNNINVNLNHQYKDTLGHELTSDFDFGRYDSDRNSYIPNKYVTPDYQTPLSSTYYRSITPTTINIFTFKSDYTQNLFKGKVGFGVKTSFVTTDNTFNFYNIEGNIETLDDSRSNQFEYTENVNAVYLNYQRTIKKFDFQAGVRVENTRSEGDLKSATAVDDKNVKRDYTDFFPSAGITYNVHKDHSIAAVFSSRIDRPNYQELNPFEYKLDELSFRKGNPFLNPQYSNKIELSHTYKYATTTSVSYSKTNDFFAQIADTIPGGKSYLSPRNLATEEVLSLDFSTSLQPVKWYSIYLNAGVTNQKYVADFGGSKTINTSLTAFSMYAQNTFKLPYAFTFEISGWYSSGGVWGGSFRSDAQGSIDLGLQKKLLHDKATLKFSVTDILETAPWKSYNTYAGIVNRANGNWESQQFRVSLTWRFGNTQVKGARQRSSGSESEQKRIGGGE